ncbi:hypothetical protein [Haladaptatus sp. NG-SE-30]
MQTQSSTVDSKWWYLVAATPIAFVVSWLVGILFVGWFLIGWGVGFASPRALGPFFVLTLFGVLVFGLFVTLMLVLFPLGIYLDAEAVNRSNLDWRPDSVLYALIAVVSAVATGFTLSVPVAVYYLYQRHQHVGVP